MDKLTSAQRAKLRPNQFVFPNSRKYPIPDKGHAQYAIRIGSMQLSQGRISLTQYNQIVRTVNSRFGFKAQLKKPSTIRRTNAIRSGR